ncbi:MAG: 16S rRNA (cytosine(1402)-N(4))-methyltransferase [Planctomycetes bacterium]|nr:16S rRNA (cytosine(1402)-N(4))-methyltransferase [Planctomycetota bacterium]
MCRDFETPRRPVGPTSHTPVLLDEVIEVLQPERGGWFVDATVGGGGHAEALLEAGPDVRLIAIDRDSRALARSQERLARFGDRVQFVHAPFSALEGVLPEQARGCVAGILADFGVSSDQLDEPEAGFSFQHDGPLDMRMDRRSQKTSAAVLLANAGEDQLEEWLREYGEERFSRRIAHAIVQARRVGPLLRTTQLADLIERTVPRGRRGIHPATRTFQALRIVVNRELDEIDAFLESAPRVLGPGGRLAVISFHSLEDRRAKLALRNEVRSGDYRDLLPRGVVPGPAEQRRNPRSRSARLRAVARQEAGE